MPEDNSDTFKDYHSFLLRLWLENNQLKQSGTIKPVWRASLKNPQTGQSFAFSSVEELCTYLNKITEHTVRRRKTENQGENLP